MSAAEAAVAVRDQARSAPTAAAVPRVRLQDLGRARSTTRIDVAVALKYRQPDELEAFIAATSDPRSPQYGHFLSQSQFVTAFGPTLADYDRVVRTLARAGFTLGATTPNHTLIHASAPAAVVEAFFHTTLHNVRQPGIAQLRYANVSPASIPATISDVTYGVAGLNNLVVEKTQNTRLGHQAGSKLGFPLQGPDTGLGPLAFATAYDLPVQHQRVGAPAGQTYDGTGRKIGIAIDSDILDSDLTSFLSYFNVKRTGPPLARINVDGGPGGVNFDGVETALDAETISSLAPGAAVSLYLMPVLSDLEILNTYDKVVADNTVDVLNSSFGGCEISTDNFAKLSDHIAQQGVAQGITFAASTGDFGAQTCLFVTPTNVGVSAPASGPHFTAAGGTSLIVNEAGTYEREYAWLGSGGGVSTIFAVPPYQQKLANIITTGRNIPDVSFDANPGTGAALFLSGAFSGPIGGTSLSSPILASLVAEYDETVGRRSGNLNYALYSAFRSTGYGVYFRDITIGNNSQFGPGYNASAGYDAVTGIGSVIGTRHAK